MDQKREMLRHFLAALAYRTQKALRGATYDFAQFDPGGAARTPQELVRHMTSVLGYARTFFIGGTYQAGPLALMSEEVTRFHEMLADLAAHLEKATPFLEGLTPERMLQGPFSDAMTHAGQLAMLRRLAGEAIPPENFIAADISGNRLGIEQSEPVSPDEFWPEAPVGRHRG